MPKEDPYYVPKLTLDQVYFIIKPGLIHHIVVVAVLELDSHSDHNKRTDPRTLRKF